MEDIHHSAKIANLVLQIIQLTQGKEEAVLNLFLSETAKEYSDIINELINALILMEYSFNNYKLIIRSGKEFTNYMVQFRSDLLGTISQDKSKEVFDCLSEIEDIGNAIRINSSINYLKHINQEQIINNHESIEQYFFDNNSSTPDFVDKRFRELKIMFHPDKYLFLQEEEYRYLPKIIFQAIEDYVSILKTTQNSIFDLNYQIDDNKSQGDSLQRLAKIINAVIKIKEAKEGDNISKYIDMVAQSVSSITPEITYESIYNNKTLEELKKLRFEYASQSIPYFRQALRGIDDLVIKHNGGSEWVKQQISLRSTISLSFHYCEFLVEAQLHIIAAMNIIADTYELTSDEKIKAIGELQVNLNIFRGLQEKQKSTQTEGISPESSSISTSTALVKVLNELKLQKNSKISEDRIQLEMKHKLKKAVFEDIKQWLVDNTIRADTSMTRFLADQNEIIRARKHAFSYEIASYTTSGISLLAGGAAVTTTTLEIAGFATGSTALLAMLGPFGVTLSVFGIIGAGLSSYLFMKKSISLGQEPKIRETLSNNISMAVQEILSGKVNEGFDLLSKPYTKGTSLLSFDNKKISIDPKHIIKELIKHKFRADGIAFLLNMIAEGLMSRKLTFDASISTVTQTDLNSLAKVIFTEINVNEELMTLARKLDDDIFATYKNSRNFNFWKKWFSEENISEKDLQHIYHAPIVARLIEMRNISQINLIVLLVLDRSEDGLEKAGTQYRDLKERMSSNYQYFSHNEYRLEALEDFLYALNVPIERITNDNSIPTQTTDEEEKQSHLIWGENKLKCSNIQELNPNNDLFKLLNDLHLHCDNITCELLYQLIDEYIQKDINASFFNEDEFSFKVNNKERIYSDYYDLQQHLQFFQESQIIFPMGSFLNRKYFDIFPNLFDNCDGFVPCINIINTRNYQLAATQSNQSIKPKGYLFGYTFDNNEILSIFHIERTNEDELLSCLLAVLYQKINDRITTARKEPKDAYRWYDIYQLATGYLSQSSISWKIVWANTYLFNLTSFYDDKPSSWLTKFGKIQREEERKIAILVLESLIHMGKFRNALYVFSQVKGDVSINQLSEFWYWSAIAARKLKYYIEASFAIHRALQLTLSDKSISQELKTKAKEELRIIDILRTNEITKPVSHFLTNSLVYSTMIPSSLLNSDLTEYFDVLSIDGGGIRGILPAYILSEIERRAKVPLHKLFHLHAGTSTGAIIAAALSLPSKINNDNQPFLARDILQLYCDSNNSQKIFERTFHLLGITGSKYTTKRSEVLSTVLGDLTMCDSMNDLLIMTTTLNPEKGCPLKNCSLENDSWKGSNTRVIDALMASSAAPTFFPSHTFDGKEYIDGGLVANNPASEAYYYAKERKLPNQKIRIWSFGTGNLLPDPSQKDNTSTNQGALFWAGKGVATIINGQETTVDNNLNKELNDHYTRFQVWLNEAIRIDDISEDKLSSLLENARQFCLDHNQELDNMVKALLTNRGINFIAK